MSQNIHCATLYLCIDMMLWPGSRAAIFRLYSPGFLIFYLTTCPGLPKADDFLVFYYAVFYRGLDYLFAFCMIYFG